jgi:hypothetical protein
VPRARALAAVAGVHDALGEPVQLFDEREADHDRDRPRLADRQLRRTLVRGREVDDRLEVQPPGRVRDQLAREDVYARVAFERTIGQLRQLEVVPTGQVLADLADLILDDVVVVTQPLFSADRLRVFARRRREKQVGVVETVGAAVEPWKQRPPAAGIGRERVCGGNPDGVRFELIGGEGLRSRSARLPGRGIHAYPLCCTIGAQRSGAYDAASAAFIRAIASSTSAGLANPMTTASTKPQVIA